MFFADIIFFAAIAIFIVLRLRSVLGKRIGHEQTFMPKKTEGTADRIISLPERERGEGLMERKEDVISPDDIGNPEVVAGLMAIRNKNPGFEPRTFLTGAKAAFEMIINAYNQGDADTLRMLLSKDLYKRFDEDMQERKESGRREETTLVAIKDAEITEVELKGSHASITTRFISEQIHLVRDGEGKIIEGKPSDIHQMEDLWVFSRDVTSADPNWVLESARSAS